MRLHTFVLLSSFILLSGCASGFEQNYHPVLPSGNIAPLKPCAIPKVEKMRPHADADEVKAKMRTRGYVLIGEAQWESISDESNETALEQGQKVGACLVLWRRLDAGIMHTTRTVSDYHPAYTKTIKVRGKHGTETKTIEVPAQTTYHDEPVDYQRYDYMGLFFAKTEGGTGALGIDSAAPSIEYMAKHDSRRGILVVSVEAQSLAYDANIFPGDVILKLNGQDVHFGTPPNLQPNQENVLIIERNGKHLTKKIYTGQKQSYM